MTPEERARQIALESSLTDDAYAHLIARISTEIHAAVAAERQACAQLAESHGAEWDDAYCDAADTYDPVAAGNMATGQTARDIAAAIRAREAGQPV